MKNNQASLTAANIALMVSLLWCEDGDSRRAIVLNHITNEGQYCCSGHDFLLSPFTTNTSSILQADLLKSIPLGKHGFSVIPWMLIHCILSYKTITRYFLWWWRWFFGKSKTLEGVWMRKLYMEYQVRSFLNKKDDDHHHNDNDVSENNHNDHKNKNRNKQKNNINNNYTNNNNASKKQVLIIGAGYDTLALRLANEYPHVNFFEIDHPATGTAKLEALMKLWGRQRQRRQRQQQQQQPPLLPKNLFFHHVDLAENDKTTAATTTTLKEVLQQKPRSIITSLWNNHPSNIGVRETNTNHNKMKNATYVNRYDCHLHISLVPPKFNFDIPTVVIVEGLTMYLTKEQNRSLFHQIGSIVQSANNGHHPDTSSDDSTSSSHCPSIVAFNFFQLDSNGRPINANIMQEPSSLIPNFHKYLVALFGEPFIWGIHPNKLQSFLADCCYCGCSDVDGDHTNDDGPDSNSDATTTASDVTASTTTSSADTLGGYWSILHDPIMLGIEYDCTIQWVTANKRL